MSKKYAQRENRKLKNVQNVFFDLIVFRFKHKNIKTLQEAIMKMYRCDSCGITVGDNERWKNGTEFRHLSKDQNHPCGGKWKEVEERKEMKKDKPEKKPIYAMDIAQEIFISRWPKLSDLESGDNAQKAVADLLAKAPDIIKHYAEDDLKYTANDKEFVKVLEKAEAAALGIIKAVNAHLKNHYGKSILNNEKIESYLRDHFSRIHEDILKGKK